MPNLVARIAAAVARARDGCKKQKKRSSQHGGADDDWGRGALQHATQRQRPAAAHELAIDRRREAAQIAWRQDRHATTRAAEGTGRAQASAHATGQVQVVTLATHGQLPYDATIHPASAETGTVRVRDEDSYIYESRHVYIDTRGTAYAIRNPNDRVGIAPRDSRLQPNAAEFHPETQRTPEIRGLPGAGPSASQGGRAAWAPTEHENLSAFCHPTMAAMAAEPSGIHCWSSVRTALLTGARPLCSHASALRQIASDDIDWSDLASDIASEGSAQLSALRERVQERLLSESGFRGRVVERLCGSSRAGCDTYLVGDGSSGTRLLAPKFTWHGFQHVVVTPGPGVTFSGEVDAVSAHWTTSDLSRTASIRFGGEGAELLSSLDQIVLNSQLSNLAGCKIVILSRFACCPPR